MMGLISGKKGVLPLRLRLVAEMVEKPPLKEKEKGEEEKQVDQQGGGGGGGEEVFITPQEVPPRSALNLLPGRGPSCHG